MDFVPPNKIAERAGFRYWRSSNWNHNSTTLVQAAGEFALNVTLFAGKWLVARLGKKLTGETRKSFLYDKIWQAFAVLLPVRTGGVMGDDNTVT